MDQKWFSVKDENKGQFVEEFAVGLSEIGSHARSANYSSNADILNAIPIMEVPAIDVMGLLNGRDLNGPNLQNTLAGMAMMINRLVFEHRYLAEELQSLKTPRADEKICFDLLAFKKTNINNRYDFEGANDIPRTCLNDLVDSFDKSCTRRDKATLTILRRFIKYLLENVIPKESHHKFTIRERSGHKHLTELPFKLTNMIQDMCLESVNLLYAQSDEDRKRRADLKENLFSFMKCGLQEIRRTPRKAVEEAPADEEDELNISV